MLELGWLVNHTKVVITSFWVGGRTSPGPTVVAWLRPATYNLRSFSDPPPISVYRKELFGPEWRECCRI